MSWELSSIGEYAKVISGYAFKSADFQKNSDVPIIKIKNIRHGFVELDRDFTVESQFLKLDGKFHCNKGDILISLTGSHITLPNSVVGRVAKYQFEETSLLNQRAGKVIVKNPDVLHQTYLYYQLNRPEIRIKLAQFGRGGANQVNISPSNVESVEIPIPPLPTQKKIANILSAYDYLIENNLRRIKLLEEAAQHIYKEWFVHFRFPNHEQVEMDKETGLPKGWEKKVMTELMDVSGGGTPSTKNPDYWDGGNVLWFSPTDLSKNTSLILTDSAKKITTEGLKNSSAKLLPPKTILMSSRATIGLFGMIEQECSTNQGFINIVPKEESLRYYILFNLIDRKNEIIGNASGATFKEISKKTFKSMPMILPQKEIYQKFQSMIEPILSQTKNLEYQNLSLKESRDILLPRLMNQTITV